MIAICFVVDHTTAAGDSPPAGEMKISNGIKYKP
jgi:hypothetical protein